jgi:hypothetical protein
VRQLIEHFGKMLFSESFQIGAKSLRIPIFAVFLNHIKNTVNEYWIIIDGGLLTTASLCVSPRCL